MISSKQNKHSTLNQIKDEFVGKRRNNKRNLYKQEM